MDSCSKSEDFGGYCGKERKILVTTIGCYQKQLRPQRHDCK